MNKMKKKYTHLFFDLDNTLWDFKNNSFRALQQTFIHFNLHLRDIAFGLFYDEYERNNKQLWEGYRSGSVRKKELTRLRFSQTLLKFQVDDISPDEMNRVYLTGMPRQNQLIDGALELLGYLKSKGCHLFILTNGFREVQYEKLEVAGLHQFFTRVFISEDVKAPKPSREIFEYAIKSANAKKRSSLMIGDDVEVDVAGALNVGMDAVWFNPGLHPEHDKLEIIPRSRVTRYTISSLLELRDIV